jgi:chromosome segregation ATPase
LLQQQLNIITNKWMLATETISRLTTDLQHLESVEKELIDTANYVKDLEQQLQKTAILESDIKSMEAEREWLLLQLQEIKTHQHHDYAHLQSNYTTLLEERNLLQDKIVLLESEVGALSRVLNNNKQKQNEDAWWETKYLIAARELEAMRRQYAAMENELSIAKNKEQVLREKAKQAEGLKATLHLRQQELEALQRELYLCSKK